MRAAVIAAVTITLTLVLGCSKHTDKSAPAKKAPVTAGAVGSDGVRRIAVTADKAGYTPGEIAAKPNEKLVLVFTRTVDGDCLSQVIVGDAAPVDLPKNTPVDVPVTVPASGSLAFVCGMDMVHGTIIVAGS